MLTNNVDAISVVVQHMKEFYNSNLTLSDYAEMCNLSKFHFTRVFKQAVGVSPLEYRRQICLEHAAEMMRDEYASVEEVAEKVGYSSASYFSSAFKHKYGVSPKQYQKKLKKK